MLQCPPQAALASVDETPQQSGHFVAARQPASSAPPVDDDAKSIPGSVVFKDAQGMQAEAISAPPPFPPPSLVRHPRLELLVALLKQLLEVVLRRMRLWSTQTLPGPE
jgi:hypothetical protein